MLKMLKEVLIGYAELDYEVGYVQGMNFVASALVYHSCDAYNSLKVMKHLMKVSGMRRLFMGDLSFGRKIAEKLNLDLRRLSYHLHSYLVLSMLPRFSKASICRCSRLAGTSHCAAVLFRLMPCITLLTSS